MRRRLRPRRVAAALALAALAAALVPAGRWEGRRAADEQLRGIAGVAAAIGPTLEALEGPTLTAYRDAPNLDCMTYQAGENPFGLQVCFDEMGRITEAVDRRSGEPRYWSVVYDPEVAPIAVDAGKVDAFLLEHDRAIHGTVRVSPPN